MKILSFILVFGLMGYIALNAQTIITFTANQPSELVANAGSDTSIVSGASITLGHSPAVNGGTEPYSYVWNDGISFISTEANPSVNPTDSTTYTLTIIDGNTCIATSDIIVKIGITYINDSNDDIINIYPNPVTDRFIVDTKRTNCRISLISESGFQLWTKSLNGKTSFAAPSVPGVYILKIIDGEKVSVRRIVITN